LPRDRLSPGLAEQIFAGDGEMATLMRAVDWSASGFGPLESWPENLTSLVSVCLSSRVPFALYWGPDLHILYNDAWRPIGGAKHPRILCTPGHDVWPEIWDVLGPMFHGVMQEGKNVWAEDALLLMHRSGYVEECYFSFNLSPARGNTGQVDGVVNIGIETT
jgi:hypothetical protein